MWSKLRIDRLRLRWRVSPRATICWFVDGTLRFCHAGVVPCVEKKHIHIFCPQNLWWKIHGESNLMVNRIRNKKITNKIESKEFMNVFIQSSWLPVWGPQIAWFSLKYIPSLKLTAISETWKNGITGKGASFKHQFSVANSLIVSRRVLYSMKKRARNEHHDFSCKDGSYLEL